MDLVSDLTREDNKPTKQITPFERSGFNLPTFLIVFHTNVFCFFLVGFFARHFCFLYVSLTIFLIFANRPQV